MYGTIKPSLLWLFAAIGGGSAFPAVFPDGLASVLPVTAPAGVPTTIAAGLGGGTTVPASAGLPDPLFLALALVCAVVGIFAILMSAGAAWRIVPAKWRRSL